MPSGGHWLGIGWAPWRGGGVPPPLPMHPCNSSPPPPPSPVACAWMLCWTGEGRLETSETHAPVLRGGNRLWHVVTNLWSHTPALLFSPHAPAPPPSDINHSLVSGGRWGGGGGGGGAICTTVPAFHGGLGMHQHRPIRYCRRYGLAALWGWAARLCVGRVAPPFFLDSFICLFIHLFMALTKWGREEGFHCGHRRLRGHVVIREMMTVQ